MVRFLAKNQNWAKAAPVFGIISSILIFTFFKTSDLMFWALINIPLYLFHQTEEHLWPGGFKRYANTIAHSLQDGKETLSDIKIFWINILLVWFAFTIFGVLALYNIGFGLLIIVFSIINCITHIVEALKRRVWNPGLVMASIQFVVSLYAAYYVTANGLSYPLVWWVSCVVFSVGIHIVLFEFIIQKEI